MLHWWRWQYLVNLSRESETLSLQNVSRACQEDGQRSCLLHSRDTYPAQLFCLSHLLVSSFILFVIITDKKIKICLKNYLGMLYQNSARWCWHIIIIRFLRCFWITCQRENITSRGNCFVGPRTTEKNHQGGWGKSWWRCCSAMEVFHQVPYVAFSVIYKLWTLILIFSNADAYGRIF